MLWIISSTVVQQSTRTNTLYFSAAFEIAVCVTQFCVIIPQTSNSVTPSLLSRSLLSSYHFDPLEFHPERPRLLVAQEKTRRIDLVGLHRLFHVMLSCRMVASETHTKYGIWARLTHL